VYVVPVDSKQRRTRVLIADDSAVTRFGVRTALEQAGIEVCAEAADSEAAVQQAICERPDVCLLDMKMPKGGGVGAVREITRALPGTPIVMLTASESGGDLLAALREGAWGYILKDEDLTAITRAVQSAAAGERPISKRAMRDLLRGGATTDPR
jgi:DNA-binding NarL/FixJ family response regulator